MKFTINVEKMHLTFFLVAVFAVMGIGFAVAVDTNMPYHPWDQIELPSGGATWTGLRAESAESADSADSVEWGDVQSKPNIGCVLYEDVHTVKCSSGKYVVNIKFGTHASCILEGTATQGGQRPLIGMITDQITFGQITSLVGGTCRSYGYEKGNVLCC